MIEASAHTIPEHPSGILGVVGPYDMPVKVRFFRRIMGKKDPQNATKTVNALEGHTLEIEAFTFGVKVFIHTTMPTDRKGSGRECTLWLQSPDEEEPQLLDRWP